MPGHLSGLRRLLSEPLEAYGQGPSSEPARWRPPYPWSRRLNIGDEAKACQEGARLLFMQRAW